jgi:tRNA G18 (ribose-2'-O)-methylase SpoU
VAPPPPCVVFAGSRADVSKATGFKHSALSVLAIVRRPTAVHRPLAEWLPTLQAVPGTAVPAVLVLDGVIKPENVGALFRTALAFGACGVLLSPGCADPFYRRSIRVSMGTVFQVPWTRALSWPGSLDSLRSAGFHVAGLALSDDAVSLKDFAVRRPEKVALVLGAEGDGISSQTLGYVDSVVRIPMLHGVDSLNVASAAAVAIYALT